MNLLKLTIFIEASRALLWWLGCSWHLLHGCCWCSTSGPFAHCWYFGELPLRRPEGIGVGRVCFAATVDVFKIQEMVSKFCRRLLPRTPRMPAIHRGEGGQVGKRLPRLASCMCNQCHYDAYFGIFTHPPTTPLKGLHFFCQEFFGIALDLHFQLWVEKQPNNTSAIYTWHDCTKIWHDMCNHEWWMICNHMRRMNCYYCLLFYHLNMQLNTVLIWYDIV